MDIEQLQQTLHDERNSERLQQIPDTFYTKVETFIQDLREQRNALAADHENVFNSPEAMEINQKLQRAEETLERIYNRRVGKLISQATLAVSGGTFDTSSLTETELELYNSFTNTVTDHRSNALSVLENSTTSETPNSTNTGTVATAAENTTPSDPSVNDDTDSDSSGDMATYMGDGPSTDTTDSATESESSTPTKGEEHTGGFADDLEFGDAESSPTPPETTDGGTPTTDSNTEPEPDTTNSAQDFVDEFEPENDNKDTDRVTVQILSDVGEVFGIDERTYDLSEDDVVTLPKENADPLVMRDAAKPVND